MTRINPIVGACGACARRVTRSCLALSLLAGCNESGPRVYTAQAYRAAFNCLDAYAPLSLVEARDVSSLCAPVCLRVGVSLYVSTVCAPYPGESVLAGPDDAECAAALVAPSCEDLAADAGP
jgi:hypothetical protein